MTAARRVRRLQRPVEIRRPGRPGSDVRFWRRPSAGRRAARSRLGVERFARQLRERLRRDLPVDGGGRPFRRGGSVPTASFKTSSGTTGVGSGAVSIARSGTDCAVFAACADSHSAAVAFGGVVEFAGAGTGAGRAPGADRRRSPAALAARRMRVGVGPRSAASVTPAERPGRLEKTELAEPRGELLDAVGGQVRPIGLRGPVGHLGDRLPLS